MEEEEKVAHTQCVNGGRGAEKSESREGKEGVGVRVVGVGWRGVRSSECGTIHMVGIPPC